MANLVNAERISISFGTRILLDKISLGLSAGDGAIEGGVPEQARPLALLPHLGRLALGEQTMLAHPAPPARDGERHDHPVTPGEVSSIDAKRPGRFRSVTKA